MTQIHVGAVLLFKKGTKTELEASTTIPKEGEPIFEIDTGRLKVGDGQLTYVNLPYVDNVQIVSEINSESGNDPASAAATYAYGQSIKNYADGKFVTLNGAVSNAILLAEAAEKNAIASAKTYTDKVKTDLLGEGITETFDTLVEIQDWINGDGINATELTAAIAAEAQTRSGEDAALWVKVNELIEIFPPYVAEQIGISETNMKNYIDTELGVIANGSY